VVAASGAGILIAMIEANNDALIKLTAKTKADFNGSILIKAKGAIACLRWVLRPSSCLRRSTGATDPLPQVLYDTLRESPTEEVLLSHGLYGQGSQVGGPPRE